MTGAISREELKKKMDAGESFYLVETLPKETFDHAHLPGAVNLPPDRLTELAPKLLPDKTAEIVVYCSTPDCHISETAARKLEALGYVNVRDYKGGKLDWIDAGLPIESFHHHHRRR
jgi:rhodanese-related sulfurtransferase